jgi:hypothetical protein
LILLRYLPAFVAVAGAAALVLLAPRRHRTAFTLLATLLGLTCMEAEYWVAHGFPAEEIFFFTSSVLITLAALALGARGALALGLAGLAFFAYVNIRYGAPYLLDYIMPVFYAVLVVLCRRERQWFGSGLWVPGRLETLWVIFVHAVAFWRTTALHKWDWVLGRPW